MTFSDIWRKYEFNAITSTINNATKTDVVRVLAKDRPDIMDLPVLLSPSADIYLEAMAQRASLITKERFGKTILLYAPLYLSNECANSCLYCGFSARNKAITRRTLTMDEIERELEVIASFGIRHILLVTGEAPARAGIDYIAGAIKVSRNYASFTGIEIYPLSMDGYKTLVDAGADGLTIYQETYNAPRYDDIHPAGKKKDILWRMDAPDRAGLAGMRTLGVGALLGISEPRTDAFYTALHADYLMKNYWRSHVTVSFPRMRTAEGCAVTPLPIPDRLFVQIMTAVRIVLPDAGFVVSTREDALFRDNILGLGVTQMSAASATEPGGYTAKNVSAAQFQIEDGRSVAEFAAMLEKKGYEPVMKDWDEWLKAGNPQNSI